MEPWPGSSLITLPLQISLAIRNMLNLIIHPLECTLKISGTSPFGKLNQEVQWKYSSIVPITSMYYICLHSFSFITWPGDQKTAEAFINAGPTAYPWRGEGRGHRAESSWLEKACKLGTREVGKATGAAAGHRSSHGTAAPLSLTGENSLQSSPRASGECWQSLAFLGL